MIAPRAGPSETAADIPVASSVLPLVDRGAIDAWKPEGRQDRFRGGLV
jgi:hypothetical protein